MNLAFVRLNHDWNAEPNAPDVSASPDGQDVILSFYLNPWQFPEFEEEEKGVLRFSNCSQYRLGRTNDEGWYRGQCRFSTLAPAWGEFYAILGDPRSIDGPGDWITTQSNFGKSGTHFLFYLRDNTFECVAEKCTIEPIADNALHVRRKSIPSL